MIAKADRLQRKEYLSDEASGLLGVDCEGEIIQNDYGGFNGKAGWKKE